MIVLSIFILTYIGVAFGGVPALTLDRTGIALLGAIAMLLFGSLTLNQAVAAIDFPTILLLYGLMIISAQLRLGGFYTFVAKGITFFMKQPGIFLGILMATSALFSAVLANDIVCLAFTPVLCVSLLRAGLNPVPFLIGLAVSSNIGSAATIIGNPQNMLIGQIGHLDFGAFIWWCLPPSLISLAVGYGIILLMYRDRLTNPLINRNDTASGHWPDLNKWQSTKGLTAVIILIILFFTPVKREISAIGIAGILLLSRKMKSREIMHMIDWHLITLFCALFIIIQGISIAQIPDSIMAFMENKGVDPGNPYILTVISTILSNLVSNVPASMLLLRFLDQGNLLQYYTLAASSTFAGNLITIGSIANLIVIEQAGNYGIHIGFREHAKTGIPVTLLTIAVLIFWIFMN
ncbi:MAG: anion transporter [Deltaproteobacteria bacterium]|nr:anion transporter [Deltaproteobacteria bacterium]